MVVLHLIITAWSLVVASEAVVHWNRPEHERLPLELPERHRSIFSQLFSPEQDYYGNFNGEFYEHLLNHPDEPFKPSTFGNVPDYNLQANSQGLPTGRTPDNVQNGRDTDLLLNPETPPKVNENPKQNYGSPDAGKKDDKVHKIDDNTDGKNPDSNRKDNAEGKKDDSEISKSNDYVLVPIPLNIASQSSSEINQINTVPLSANVVPAVNIQPTQNTPDTASPATISVTPTIMQNYPGSNQVVYSNQPSILNQPISAGQSNLYASNQVTNAGQAGPYTILSTSSNAGINNSPTSYFIISNGQAIPINIGVPAQNPTQQLYTLVPVNVQNQLNNQPNNIVAVNGQPNSYVLLNQPNNIGYTNPQNNLVALNQPNNYVPTNQPSYVALNNQPNNLQPLNNQPNNYVTVANVPNNAFAQPSYVVASNQPNNLVTLNNGGGTLVLQPQPSNVLLYSLKDEDKDGASSKEKESDTNELAEKHDDVHENEEPDGSIDV